MIQYLQYNKHEAEAYQKFVIDRKAATENATDRQRDEINQKWNEIQPLVKVSKTPMQELVPKFFLSKIMQMRNMEKLSGNVKDPNFDKELQSPTRGKTKDEQSSPGVKPARLGAKPSLAMVQASIDKSPNMTSGKAPFGHMLVDFKSKINLSNSLTLELRDKTLKQADSIICAREGFCMVLTVMNYTKQAKDLCVLGGIGSDVVQTLDHYSLSSRLYLLDRKERKWAFETINIDPSLSGVSVFKIYNHAGDLWINKDNKSATELVFFGGYVQTNISQAQYLSNDIYSINLNNYNLKRLVHQAEGPRPKARRGHAACVYGNLFLVLGGKNDTCDYRKDAWMFVLSTTAEIGEKPGWIRLEFSQDNIDQYEEEFADLCHHTMTVIPAGIKGSTVNDSVDNFNLGIGLRRH